MFSVRYYPRFHVTAVGLGTYYPRIRGSACTTQFQESHGPQRANPTARTMTKLRQKLSAKISQGHNQQITIK
jgi:hypothetical protein